jgi:imidazolonepropionase-like amidohydrolase
VIAEGGRADLVLLEGNPLEDIAQVRRRAGVMVRGEWFPADRLEALLRKLEQRYAGEAGR